MGKNAIMKYRENPALFVVGYELDKEFWNTLLKVGEEYNEEFVEDTTTKRSLSDQFRSSKRNKPGSSTSTSTTNTGTGSGNKPKPVNDGAGKD
tara:strand:+ start:173 stop:451 length:279 start_codon:yes stop_codon:yes gene_type:complete